MDLLKCPICYANYSLANQPYILPCGHTLCDHCITQIKGECQEDTNLFQSSDSYDSLESCNVSIISEKKENKKKSENSPKYSIKIEEEADKIYPNINEKNEEHNDENKSDSKEDEFESVSSNEDNNSSQEEENIENYYSSDTEEEESEEEESEEEESESEDNLIKIVDINKHDKEKFKFKCPYCAKRIKIKREYILLNSSIMKIIKEKSKTFGNSNQSFCQKCNTINNEEMHSLAFCSSHKNFFIPLNEKTFDSIKTSLTSLNLQELKIKSCEFINKFKDNILKNDSVIKNISIMMRNKVVNFSRNSYLKEKATKKFDYYYSQFSRKIQKENQSSMTRNDIEELEHYLSVAKYIMMKYKTASNFKIYSELNNHFFLTEKIIKNSFQYYFLKELSGGYFHCILNNTFYTETQFNLIFNKKLQLLFLADNASENSINIYKFTKKYNFVNIKNSQFSQDGLIIYFFGKNGISSNKFISYHTIEKYFKILPCSPVSLLYADTYIYKNRIYILGGSISIFSYSNSCYYYEINNNKWYEMKSLKFKKKRKCITCINDKLYTFGGKGSDISETYKFEMLDLKMENADWIQFTIYEFYETIYNFGYYLYSENALFIIGGHNQITDDYDIKGYLIDLENRKLLTSFNLSSIFVNKIGMPFFYRKELLTKNPLFEIDAFNLWDQLDKINITI